MWTNFFKSNHNNAATTTNTPSSTVSSTDTIREQQIASLKLYFPNAVEKEKFRAYVVTVPFERAELRLQVELDGNFPSSPPRFQVLLEGFTHPHLMHNGVVKPTANKDLHFWALHNDLGKLAFELVQDFKAAEKKDVVPHQLVHPQSESLKLPVIGELEKMSAEELKLIFENEEKFKEFVGTIDTVTTSVSLRNELVSRKEEMKAKREELQAETAAVVSIIEKERIRSEQLRAAYNERYTKQHSLQNKNSAQELSNLLLEKSQILDDASEETGSSFCSGEISYDEFYTKFLNERKAYHLYQLKAKHLAPPPAPSPNAALVNPYGVSSLVGTWRPT